MSVTSSESLKAIQLGTVSYDKALELQLSYHQRVQNGEFPAGVALFLEHEPVLTLGKNADPSLVLSNAQDLEQKGISIAQSDRGGEVTAHMPGQLVVYPILPLQRMRLAPKAYVDGLQQTVIKLLKAWNIDSAADPEYPGVWIGTRKVCAVGVRIRERVSMHGIALNCNNSLDLFEAIVPCGIHGRGVTSMAQELGTSVDIAKVASSLGARLSETLQVELTWL